MRVIVWLIGILVLVNIVLFLWPQKKQVAQHVYQQQQDIHPDMLNLLSEVDARENIEEAADVRCYRIGPFLNIARVKLAKALLVNSGVEYAEEKRESKNADIHRVYLGPLGENKQVLEMRTQLRDKGVLDHFEKPQEDGSSIISLGVYMKQESADNSLKFFSEKGFAAKVRQETTLLPDSYWLNLSLQGQGEEVLKDLSKMDWGEYSAQLVAFSCN